MHFRAEWFGSRFEALKQATSVSGEILALSGPRNPYSKGPLGVVEEGAYADLLLVDGNPLEDFSLLGAQPQWWEAPAPTDIRSMPVIMKGGVLVKNTLPAC
jgi:imidazolonepropionase-like amidohydrolase